jgi:hypothetical protein
MSARERGTSTATCGFTFTLAESLPFIPPTLPLLQGGSSNGSCHVSARMPFNILPLHFCVCVRAHVCVCVCVSSSFCTVQSFCTSQTLHNRIFFKKKSGDVNDEANFPPFLCFIRELNQHPPYLLPHPRARTQKLYSPLNRFIICIIRCNL